MKAIFIERSRLRRQNQIEQLLQNSPAVKFGCLSTITDQGMATTDYGNFYWRVKVPEGISADGGIYLHAHRAEVTASGDLIFWSKPTDADPEPFPVLALARGAWFVFNAVSVIDGSPVAVEYWAGYGA